MRRLCRKRYLRLAGWDGDRRAGGGHAGILPSACEDAHDVPATRTPQSSASFNEPQGSIGIYNQDRGGIFRSADLLATPKADGANFHPTLRLGPHPSGKFAFLCPVEQAPKALPDVDDQRGIAVVRGLKLAGNVWQAGP
ncbi:hypothetical protein J2X72_004478 [Phyllobacterium sp. 1468]|nr:hypothetical protein [Phyllobacterium sp. 1468]